MSCQAKSEPVTSAKSPTLSSLKCSARLKSIHGNRKCKSGVTHVAKGGRGSGGQGQVKACSAGWDPHTAAANTGHVPAGTRSNPSTLSSKVHFSCVV